MKGFLLHLYKRKNPAYVLVWMFILANVDEKGDFRHSSIYLIGRFKVPKQTLRRVIDYGLSWFGGGSSVGQSWFNNSLEINGVMLGDGSSVVQSWYGSGSVSEEKVVKNPKNKKSSQVSIKNSSFVNTEIDEIINYLNQRAGKNFRATTRKTVTLITARKREGATLEDFKKVIDIKTRKWKGGKMDDYLRPETLFSSKFEAYLNEKTNVTTEKELNYHEAISRAETSDYSSIVKDR